MGILSSGRIGQQRKRPLTAVFTLPRALGVELHAVPDGVVTA
ncbi:hypothetical protein [Paraburkholderia bryophila]|jgi:hypothetical protein|uniref:Uncharacterized protein n=1 Tax=Paraburkholderia bryophila TaxID=420952 RepID=A0A329CUM5_9BURK|nr:hypothetical protein [Paraburkholderia bryophila]RAS34515.1 hypothetical protein BX591_106196 [Paraburkholderia bryophila]